MAEAVARHAPPQRLINAVNPLVRAVIHSPLHRITDGALIELTVVGRKTGHRYVFPVGYFELDGAWIIVTQHRWRANLRGGATVIARIGGRDRSLTAAVVEDPGSVGRILAELIARHGDRVARIVGLRIRGQAPVGVDELAELASSGDLAVIRLDVPAGG